MQGIILYNKYTIIHHTLFCSNKYFSLIKQQRDCTACNKIKIKCLLYNNYCVWSNSLYRRVYIFFLQYFLCQLKIYKHNFMFYLQINVLKTKIRSLAYSIQANSSINYVITFNCRVHFLNVFKFSIVR